MTILSQPFDPSLIPPGPSYDALPPLPAIDALKAERRWVAWKYEERNGKLTKPPVNPHTGFGASSTDARTWGTYDQAVARAQRSNLAGVGFAIQEGAGIVGGDLDDCRDPETGELEPWAAEIVAFAETYVEISPSGCGLRIIWRSALSTGHANKAAQVEVYGRGRYLTITGQHVAGTPIDILPAPRTEAALLARLEAFRAKAQEEITQKGSGSNGINTKAASKEIGPSSPFFRNVNTAALAGLSQWVPTIFPGARFQPGTRAYRISSRQLGRDLQEDLSISPDGIVDFGVHDLGDPRQGKRTPIDVAIEHGGAPDAKAAAFWLAERLGRTPASLGWEEEGDAAEGARLANELIQARKAADAPIATPNPLDALTLGRDIDWTRPQGLLNDIADWIAISSRRPNRPFAVASAIVTLSAVCGRHLYGPTGTALNVYLVCLAPTGVGKGRPLGAVAELLRAAKLDTLHTSGKLFSVSALEALIADQPCCVATIDEIGANLLARMSHKKATTHEMALRGALLELWSREQGAPPFATHGRAGAKSVQVASPSLSLFGVSTPEAFYDAIAAGSIRDGFLNRFLITSAAPRAKANEVSEADRKVPQRLAQALTDIVPDAEGNMGKAVGVFGANYDAEGRRVGWGSHAVRQTALDFEEQILAVMDANPDHAPLMGRIFEYTVRLATLHAVSRHGRRATVTEQDLNWGAALVIQSARAMLDGTSALMAANDYEAKFNAVRNAIKEAGWLGRNDLLRKIRTMNAKDRDAIISHLKDGGWIEVAAKETKGRQAIGWKWVG